jgi:hypothetical protein
MRTLLLTTPLNEGLGEVGMNLEIDQLTLLRNISFIVEKRFQMKEEDISP